MQDFMDNFGGYVVIGLMVLLIGLGAFTFITSKNQNDRIAYLEQCCNDVNEQMANVGAPSITMVQVQDEVKKMIEDALASNNEQISEASKTQIEEAVKKVIADSEENIYASVYEQLVSDLTAGTLEIVDEEPKEEVKDEEKTDEKKEDEKQETQKPATQKKRVVQKKNTTDTTQTQQPAPQTQQPAQQPATQTDPDDSHFKVDDGTGMN